VVSVRNAKGNFVSNLQPAAFFAKIGGREASVTSASVFAGPIRLIIVLDASGSMSGHGDMRRWKAIKSFTEHMVASAPASVKMAMLVFNTHVIRKVEFGHSRTEVLAAVEELPDAKERTSLWDSLLETSVMFGDPAPGDAMLVMSDFGDNVSKANVAEVQRAFVAKGIRMFGVGIYHPFANHEENDLLAIVRQTGGDAITDIGKYRYAEAGFIKQLFDKVGTFYVLKITSSAPLPKRDRLDLSVLAGDGKKSKRVVLHYPQQLTACFVQ